MVLARGADEKDSVMKKSTAEKLDRHYADWTKDGSRPKNMTTEFVDTIRDACDESVAKDFYWLPRISQEQASENAQVKIKVLLITKHGAEAIKSLPAMVSTICYREACTEARKSCVIKRDSKTGVVVIDKQTGRVKRVPKTISLDWKDDDDDAHGYPTIEDLEGNLPSPVDELEKKDQRQLLRKINIELQKMPRQKADTFRLVVFAKLSALTVARLVYHSTVKDTDAPSTKKQWQDRIACTIRRTKMALVEKFESEAEDIGILRKQQAHSRYVGM